MLAHIKLHLTDPCEYCGGTGREEEVRILPEPVGQQKVWLGPCPQCTGGRTPSADGVAILAFVARFGTPERMARLALPDEPDDAEKS